MYVGSVSGEPVRCVGTTLYCGESLKNNYRMVEDCHLKSLVRAEVNELSMAGFLCLHFCTLSVYYT
jgi:hypothetical protein